MRILGILGTLSLSLAVGCEKPAPLPYHPVPAPVAQEPRAEPASHPALDLDSQMGRLVAQISEEMSGSRKTSIAVVEFSNLDGSVNELGKLLSEELITRLYQTRKFNVVERNMLNKLLKEQKLESSGLIDGDSAKTLGRLLGVDALVSGSISDLDDRIRVNARLINTESGMVFGVASGVILKDKSIRKLMAAGAAHAEEVVAGNPAPKPASAPAPPSALKVSKGGLSFEVMGAHHTDAHQLVVEVAISNLVDEFRLVAIQRTNSILVGADGTSYPLDYMVFGSDHGVFSVGFKMPPRVPTKAMLTFPQVPSGQRTFASVVLAVKTFDDAGRAQDVQVALPGFSLLP